MILVLVGLGSWGVLRADDGHQVDRFVAVPTSTPWTNSTASRIAPTAELPVFGEQEQSWRCQLLGHDLAIDADQSSSAPSVSRNVNKHWATQSQTPCTGSACRHTAYLVNREVKCDST